MRIIDVEELKEVLEFEPLNIKTDGSIDRKTVIDFLSGIANLDPKLQGSLVMYVMSLPDVQPEQPAVKRRRGKWNAYYHGVYENPSFSYSCNQCGCSAPYGMYGGEYSQKQWTFCPNCGADMRGGDSE